MFSYVDRMKAVLLYIKYDRGVAATVRDLGYPTPETLKRWCREYISADDLHGVKGRKKKFTAEQQRLAVNYYTGAWPPQRLQWKSRLDAHKGLVDQWLQED